MNATVLVVDDDPLLRAWIAERLGQAGLSLREAPDGAAGLAQARRGGVEALVLDVRLPDVSGVEVLRALRAEQPHLPVVVITADDSIDVAVECMRLGAVDFVQKPLDALRLTTSVRNACEQGRLRARMAQAAAVEREARGLERLLGASPAMERTRELLRRAAGSDVTVLLLGETGTGKEVAARALHAESARAGGPFVAVNCGALPEALVESELFGHERGAFTGAGEARPGLFERGHRGTVFLDEVAELPLPAQVKLLRVLQERVVQRLGSGTERAVDVRLVAATNRDLGAEARAGRFREDLLYRLDVLRVTLPALRTRTGDVALLAQHFLLRESERHRRELSGFEPAALAALQAWDWPGNVRELRNVIERAVILAAGPCIGPDDLSDAVVCRHYGAAEPATAGPECADDGLIRPLEEEERRLVERALRLTGWNVHAAADRLGMGRATLYRRLNAWGLQRPPEGDAPPVAPSARPVRERAP